MSASRPPPPPPAKFKAQPPPPPPPTSSGAPPPPPPANAPPPPPTTSTTAASASVSTNATAPPPPVVKSEPAAVHTTTTAGTTDNSATQPPKDEKPTPPVEPLLPPKIPDSELSEKDQLRQAAIRKILLLKNPFDVLGAQPEENLEQIKRKYKKLALLIHPDKCKLAKTGDAFDRLGKAMKKLEDEDLFESFAKMVEKAREDMANDQKMQGLTDEQRENHRIELVNKQLHTFEKHVTTSQKYRDANKKWEHERAMIEREREKFREKQEEAWEETRDSRVHSWRDFNKSAKKKKKAGKTRGLWKPPKAQLEKRKPDQVVPASTAPNKKARKYN